MLNIGSRGHRPPPQKSLDDLQYELAQRTVSVAIREFPTTPPEYHSHLVATSQAFQFTKHIVGEFAWSFENDNWFYRMFMSNQIHPERSRNAISMRDAYGIEPSILNDVSHNLMVAGSAATLMPCTRIADFTRNCKHIRVAE